MKTAQFGLICFAALIAAPAAAQDSIDRTGMLETADEQRAGGAYVDEYVIEGNAGDLLEVHATSAKFDTLLMVSGPGDVEFENDDASATSLNSRIFERLPASGSYTISVTSYEAGSTGPYDLRASASARPVSNLRASVGGDLANGDEQLESGEYKDTYIFEGEAGDLIEIDLSSEDFDPYLMLRGPGVDDLDNDDAQPGNSAANIIATLPESGEYRVTVTSYAPEEMGQYQLDVAGAEVETQPSRSPLALYGDAPSTGQLSLDAPVNGSLGQSDPQLDTGAYFDIYTLAAEPGTRLTVRMTSDQIDTSLAAFGSDGFQAANDDDAQAEGTTNSRIEVMVPLSGVITVAATSYGSEEKGGYSLSVEPAARGSGGLADAANSEPIALGDAVGGTLSASRNSYLLESSGQQEVEFALTSGDFDTILRIEGPGGFMAENDDDPLQRTLNSRLRTVLPQAGTYRIVVSGYGGDARGDYRLVTGLASEAGESRGMDGQALALGERVSAALASGDDTLRSGEFVDFYSFEGTRGQRLDFTMDSSEFDTYLSLRLPDGELQTNDDQPGGGDTNSRLSITLPEDGTYEVAATSYAVGEEGTYQLRVEPLDASVRAIAPTSSGSRVFALSVGVADYERVSTLPLTDRDARKLSETLEAAGVLAPESVTLLNADATRENFEDAFNTISAAIGPDDLLLVFFSGHGDKVEGVDTEMDGSSETIELFDAALHDYELADMFSNIDARTLLVIDACFSGGFDNVIDQRVDRMGIFSSDSDVLSLVAEKFEAGGFVSLLLREALGGAADTDFDNAITAGELSEYMRLGFYRIALQAPLDAGGEDFRGEETLGYQHLIVDRGGDGMPYGQVLLHISADQRADVAEPAAPVLSLAD